MSLSKTYQRLLKERFVLVQCVQTSLLMTTGDILAQEIVEKRGWKYYNSRRTLEFAFLGCCLVGPAVTAWYKLLARQFGHGKNPYTAIRKVAADQLIFAPSFLCCFITCVGLLQGCNFEETKQKLRKEYFDILVTNWKIWPGIQIINFYFMPLKYQILLVQSVAVLWNTYLCWKTGNVD